MSHLRQAMTRDLQARQWKLMRERVRLAVWEDGRSDRRASLFLNTSFSVL